MQDASRLTDRCFFLVERFGAVLSRTVDDRGEVLMARFGQTSKVVRLSGQTDMPVAVGFVIRLVHA